MDKIEIPFGAYDSETLGWTYTIPKGYTVKIEDGKIVVKKEELEDEKIKKSLVKFLKSLPIKHRCEYAASELENWLTWLEKQKEQKPAEWSNFDKGVLNDVINAVDLLGNVRITKNANEAKAFRVAKDWLETLPERFNLQPKQEWGEEDEDKLEQCIRIVSGWERDYDIVKSPYSNFLKSLRPQPRWKPSEEQMCYLKKVYESYDFCDGERDALESLYNDLKKLGVKEEPEYYQHFDSDC